MGEVYESVLGCGALTHFLPHLLPHLTFSYISPYLPTHLYTLSYTSSQTSCHISPSSPHTPTHFPTPIPTSPSPSQSVAKLPWNEVSVAKLLATDFLSKFAIQPHLIGLTETKIKGKKEKVRDSGCKHTLFRSFSIVGPLQFSITND